MDGNVDLKSVNDITAVSLTRCTGYEPHMLMQVFEQSLSDIGFDKKRFKGATVAVKPNLLTVAADDSGIITHPEFFHGAMTCGFAHPKPVIHIMDAIVAMEGEGPGQGGRPRQLNAVIAGMDAIAVDWAASQIAGIDITKVPTIVRGFERGYGAASPEEIRIIGHAIDKFQVNDFVPATGNSLFANAFRWPLNTRTFKNLFVERPVPDPQLCTGCGQCIKICPAGAISLPKKAKSVPEYDYGICIRCYCCLEICPEGALGKKPGRLQWLVNIMDR